MSRAGTDPSSYLAIPQDYCRSFGGLRWCASGEAVEAVARDPAIGCTFAMAGEIALFLEGYGDGGPLICFGFVLHLLQLLDAGVGASDRAGRPGRFADLSDAFRETHRPIRNAGALCASLCREIPCAADPPDRTEIDLFLRCWSMVPQFRRHRPRWPAEEPPLDPAGFEARVLEALGDLTRDDLRHWLRHGRGPIVGAGEALARALPRPRDVGFGDVLADIERRPRLAGAVPLVERLDGALALPPRRLAHAEVPTGGYSDIATRGKPEQILPAQFALDEIEFLRRFAEHELLYFHREEPHAPVTDEQVIVVDQGVRTWGDVRLVLAAAALALVRHAARHGTPSRIATTAAPGRVVPCDAIDPEALGTLLEASDLSPHPGATLGDVLGREGDRGKDDDEPAARARDVVLLTHPLNLREPEVAAAACRAPAGTRLFAIAFDGGGGVEFAELRRGVPVVLRRCRVDVRPPVAPRPRPSKPAENCTGPPNWRGDVEPIGFPFRLGIQDPIEDDRFDFDEGGDWLMAAIRPHGTLHAWRVDGQAAEVLPRARVEGEILSRVRAVVGVAGGFVVIGRGDGNNSHAAHYDLNNRICIAHDIAPLLDPASWTYLRRHHSLVIRDDRGRYQALDLGVSKEQAKSSRRAVRAGREAPAAFAQAPEVVFVDGTMPESARAVRLDPSTGRVDVQFAPGERRSCTPQGDGQPALKGGRIVAARSGGHLIAVLFRTPQRSFLKWFLDYQITPLVSHALPAGVTSFALSRDGLRFACRVEDRRLVVRDVGGVRDLEGTAPTFVTPKGKWHTTLDVALGDSFLTVKIGKHAHLIRWHGERLELSRNTEGNLGKLLAAVIPLDVATMIPAKGGSRVPRSDQRFVAECRRHGLKVLVDVFGQVAVCDDVDGTLICMFFVFRDRVAAWMPDGTRIGPLSINGGPATPDGHRRIGAALRMAQSRARGHEKGRHA